MHSLEQIERNNERAVGKAVRQERARGKHVAVVYAGLNQVTYVACEQPIHAAAQAAALRDEYPEGSGCRVVVLPPLGEAEAALVLGRDQSEDYVAA